MIKNDRRNYRKHTDENKKIIKKSLAELGAGRSILLDKNDEIIAGNGVYEQAQSLNIPVKVVETDGTELVVVKRTDLKTKDDKRKKLAIMDNSASDSSFFDYGLLQKDFKIEEMADLGIDLSNLSQDVEEFNKGFVPQGFTEEEREQLPEEIQTGDIAPDEIEKFDSDFKTEYERIIITFPFDRQGDLERLLGIPLNKIFYDLKEILEKRGEDV